MSGSQDPELAALREFHVSPAEWDELSKICKFLAPLESITRLMCEEAYPTSAHIIPKFNQLYDYFDAVVDQDNSVSTIVSDVVVEAATKGREVLHKYYTKTNAATMLCMVLDPRFKLEYFKKNGFPQEEIDAVVQLYFFIKNHKTNCVGFVMNSMHTMLILVGQDRPVAQTRQRVLMLIWTPSPSQRR